MLRRGIIIRASSIGSRIAQGRLYISRQSSSSAGAISINNSSKINKYYDGLLADLKRKDSYVEKNQTSGTDSPSVYSKSFNDISADDLIRSVPRDSVKDETWNSSYDSVTRSPYARDVGHLEILLDALVSNKNFARAENILKAIQPLLSESQNLIYQVNKYLEAFALEDSVSEMEIAHFIEQIPEKFHGVAPDSRTWAILVRKLSDSMHVIKKLGSLNSSWMTKKILTHIDVLGDDKISELLANPEMRIEWVPKALVGNFEEIQEIRRKDEELLQRQLQKQVESDVHLVDNDVSQNASASEAEDDLLSVFEGLDVEQRSPSSSSTEADISKQTVSASAESSPSATGNPEILEKDVDELISVDSFGLKVIRQSLLGLNSDSTVLQDFIENLEADAETNILSSDASHNKRDYFEIYKSLKTPEQKEEFNNVLNIFNEERQKQLELKGLDAAKDKWKNEYESMKERGTFLVHKSLNVQLFDWYSKMLPLVKQEVAECKILLEEPNIINKHKMGPERDLLKDRLFYAPYLTLVPPEKLCAITILEILKLNSTGGVVDGMRTARAVVSVGRAIELEYKSQKLLEIEGKSLNRKVNTKNISELRQYIQKRRDIRNPALESNTAPNSSGEWTGPVYAKTGELLTRLLLYVAVVPVKTTDPSTGEEIVGYQPALHHTFQYINGQKLGVLKIHKELLKKLAGEKANATVQPQLLPMLVKPRPWTSYNDGGYLYSSSYLVRIKDSPETIAYLKASLEKGHLDEVYEGLNVLGETAWTVNRKIFDVISQKWNTGEKFLDIPEAGNDPVLPKEAPPKNADPSVKRNYQRVIRKALNDAASARSQRCDSNYKLEIARAFIGEKLYFPHNVDFRGRAYPLSPHFNHLGGDMTRSLFLFWEGKELGSTGLEWLKIHLANLSGLDKAPLTERLQFTNDNMDKVLELARNPLSVDPLTGKNNGWWLNAEKPWQALSVCFELAEAYKLEDPTKYISHIPVHQDGTCNGLQHYAALGGDIEGARQVNLLPADRPQDVYKFVANLVQKRIDIDAANGEQFAIFMQDKLTRKVVKQTVMTNVYGVTFVGGVAQIEKQIDHYFTNEQRLTGLPSQVSKYLARLVFSSMRELFEGAHQIQDWLGVCAKRISRSIRIDYEGEGQHLSKGKNGNKKPDYLSSVIWTTPLGLPCVQPYRSIKKQVIATNLQDIVITDPFGAAPVDARKQQTAFPPNFVHSLDATHMLLTSRAAGESGIAFASVHDSYWTHACDIDLMNSHCRNQFIKLHEDNLISKIRNEFERRYRGYLQVIHISGEHPVGTRIKQVRKELSESIGRAVTVADEIYLERSRQSLLDSQDPLKVRMGQEMITTISVTEGEDLEKEAVPSGSSKAIQVLVPLKFPDIPTRGELDIDEIKKSKYFFS